MTPLAILLVAATVAAPLDAGQQARLTAWLQWAGAYRECYEPAPFSLRIDEDFTSRCIQHVLRREERAGPPGQRAATKALILATPRLVALLNAPAERAGAGKNAPGIDPGTVRAER